MKKCGFVAIVGRPNVGKSTLLNHIVGEKVSITANKPQTTRNRILGVKTVDDNQVVYVDTPGMHLKQTNAINRYMNREARASLIDVDLVVMVIEALKFNKEDYAVIEKIKNLPCKKILVINKIDAIDKSQLLPFIAKMSEHKFDEIVPICAIKGFSVEILENLVFKELPEGEFYFANTTVTDKNDKFRYAEIVREKLTRELGQELPYSVAVEIEKIEEHEEQREVYALIWVERASQKGIVIGKQGNILKKIGNSARRDMNMMQEKRVHLNLWVRVRDGWSDSERALQSMGIFATDDYS